jgi:hypothetical protein
MSIKGKKKGRPPIRSHLSNLKLNKGYSLSQSSNIISREDLTDLISKESTEKVE